MPVSAGVSVVQLHGYTWCKEGQVEEVLHILGLENVDNYRHLLVLGSFLLT